MKLLILGGSSSRNSGGVFDTARMMGQRLYHSNGVNVQYLMFDDEYSFEDKEYYAPLPIHTYRVAGPRKLGFSNDLYGHMRTIKPDIVHTQSLWMYLSYANKKYHNATGTPYIISPHGMLDSWQLRQSFWKDLKKDIVLRLYERDHLRGAACFHALCVEEYEAIRSFGLKNPVAIIPNGIEMHDEDWSLPLSKHESQTKDLLFLSRIHPKKGLDNLLEAWALLPRDHTWRLIIAGETKDEAYRQSLEQKAMLLNIQPTVSFVGGQFGEAKRTRFLTSDAFVLPSFSEGLPMSVLEAWSYRLPVVMTPYCNLAEGYTYDAAIKVDTDPQSISEGLSKLITMPGKERLKMGQRGFEMVREKFTWAQVANSMTEMYNWVLGKADKPTFVYTD